MRRMVWHRHNDIVSDYFLNINGVKVGGVFSCSFLFVHPRFVGGVIKNQRSGVLLVIILSERWLTRTILRFFPRQLHRCVLTCYSFAHLCHVITNQLTDTADIFQKRDDFVGQASLIQILNVNYFCHSVWAGYELCVLRNDYINDLCISRWKCTRKIWGLPYTTNCFLRPLLCQCLPLVDEIHRRSLNFIQSCCWNDSSVVREVAKYIVYERHNSPIGQNASFCAHIYNCSIRNITDG